MSKKVVTKYICDICGKEHNKETDIKAIMIPYHSSDSEGRSYMISYKHFDMCLSCREKYNQIIFDKFANIYDTLGMIKVERKFDEEN